MLLKTSRLIQMLKEAHLKCNEYKAQSFELLIQIYGDDSIQFNRTFNQLTNQSTLTFKPCRIVRRNLFKLITLLNDWLLEKGNVD